MNEKVKSPNAQNVGGGNGTGANPVGAQNATTTTTAAGTGAGAAPPQPQTPPSQAVSPPQAAQQLPLNSVNEQTAPPNYGPPPGQAPPPPQQQPSQASAPPPPSVHDPAAMAHYHHHHHHHHLQQQQQHPHHHLQQPQHPHHQQAPQQHPHLPPPHHMQHGQQPGLPPPPAPHQPQHGDQQQHPSKDEYGGHLPPPPPHHHPHHPAYGRYHGDPNMDPYRYGHMPMPPQQQQPPPPPQHQQQQPPPMVQSGGKPQAGPQQQQPPGGPPNAGAGPTPPPQQGALPPPGRGMPQRYIPGQPPQGPTPTLNSLLQSSHPPLPPPQQQQHQDQRYANNYDPQQQPQASQQPPPPPPNSQQQQVSGGGPPQPPPPHVVGPAHQSPYATQQGGWAPPPRPYSPQMGPSQQYRTPPPVTNAPRSGGGQSPYPPAHGQNSGSYPPSSPSPQHQQQQQQQQPQQQQQTQQQQQQQPAQQPPTSGGAPPPPPQQQQQSGGGGGGGQGPPQPQPQYAPYPQRYPTPPGIPVPPGAGHRSAYSTHQYADANRPWPGGTSPAPSPGPGPGPGPSGVGHPLPPASPHHPQAQQQPASQQQQQPPPPSPGHAPSPSPQPSQASPSPHQEMIGQNSNDSSSGGAHSGVGSGPPGTPNPQQVMRPTPSPTGSSGSRSMSPAVAQSHPISRPASNQSSSSSLQMSGGGGPPAGPLPLPPHVVPPSGQQQQQQGTNSASSASNSPQQTPPPPAGGLGQQQQQSTPQQQQQQQQPPQIPNHSMSTPPPPPQGAVGYALPPHMHGGYKMGAPGAPQGYPGPQQAQQYAAQGGYVPRPQYPPGVYGGPQPTGGQAGAAANSMPPGAGGPQQYAGRPLSNHAGGNPHAPYPPYQSWLPPSPQAGGPPPPGSPGATIGNHVQGKGTPPPVGGGPPPPSSGSPRPLNYLKQHLQHKGSYGSGAGGSTPPQGYGNGPGMHPANMPMGPPHHMGPPHGPTTMGPPASTPPQAMMGGPGSGQGAAGDVSNNAEQQQQQQQQQQHQHQQHPQHPQHQQHPHPHPHPPHHMAHDNGVNSTGPVPAHVVPAPPTVSTTGPDAGALMDEVSQQSTLSNASAASGDDLQCNTPKSRKNDPYSQSHLIQPSTSPVTHHPGVHHGEDYEINSPPSWTRTPASPQVFNSHVVPPPETFRATSTSTKKSDSLCKLYEMDNNPERREWLDKLRAFMEERRTPITACPTISKQPLDLFKLYNQVRDRGGFLEVSKSKTWKEIAGFLGIGASSSAAYTLRKHYIKNLITFEYRYDRGDADPLPIIQQVEAGSKKKSTKAAAAQAAQAAAASGATPNSQEPFPATGGVAPSQTMEGGYAGYPPPGPAGYPPSGAVPGPGPQPQPDYGPPGQRPPSQSNAQTPHGGGAPYPGQSGAYGQYGAATAEQYNATGPPPPPPGQPFAQGQGQYPPQNRSMYVGPPYGSEGEAPPSGANQYGPYGARPYSQAPPPAQAQQAGGPPQAPAQPNTAAGGAAMPPAPQAAGAPPGAPPAGAYPPSGPPPQQDYYRPPEPSPQPRRHPDFVKEPQPYGGYNARPQIYGGWQGAANQYRPQYPSSPTPQTWGNAPPRAGTPPGGPHGPPSQQTPPNVQWEQHRYGPQQGPPPPPTQQQQPPYQQQPPPGQPAQPGGQPGQPGQPPQGPPQWAQMNAVSQPPQACSPGAPMRTPPVSAQQQRGMPPNNGSPMPPQQQAQQLPQQQQAPPHGMPSVGGLVKAPYGMPPPPGAAGMGMVPPGHMLPQKPTHLGQSPAHPPHPQHGQFLPPGMKKELCFPLDSVEGTTPVLYRRRRLAKVDVCPVDPWRIFMALRSGLLAECTWAIDVLNVLLFDDTTVQYFGLTTLPGLLTLLLDHFQKNLAEMFDDQDEEDDVDSGTGSLVEATATDVDGINPSATRRRHRHLRRFASNRKSNRNRLCESLSTRNSTRGVVDTDDDDGIDLGQVRDVPSSEDRVLLLANTPNYTMVTRKGVPVRLQPAEQEIFVEDRPKAWDCDTNELYERKEATASSAWTFGLSDPDALEGIIDVFKSEIIDIPFARYLPSSKKPMAFETQQISCKRPADETALVEICAKKSKLIVDGEGSCFAQPTELKREQVAVSVMELERRSQHQQHLVNGGGEGESGSSSSNGDSSERRSIDPRGSVREPALLQQRQRQNSTYEDECYTRDEASLYLVNESQDSLARRCVAISNIFRNLSFVPGNELVLAKSTRFLAVLGRLLLLNHEHLPRAQKTRNYDREEDTDFGDSCSSLQGECEWWWEYLIVIRENMLVAIANIAGHLELSQFDELIARPLIDGLLHWAVCPSAHGQDPFPSCGPNTALSPQRLALEALCKLCVTDNNVDLVIATPPFSRLEKLCAVLTRHLCRNEDQVLREFSVNLLHYVAAADSAMARTVAMQSPCISYLVAFIEQAEQTAMGVANSHGINYLRDNPDSMGTSLDMLRRAAGTLHHLAKHPDNWSLFMQQEQRLLALVMSHILDQQVAGIISRVLYQVSQSPGVAISHEFRMHLQQQQQQLQQQQQQHFRHQRQVQSGADTSSPSSDRRHSLRPMLKEDIKVEQQPDTEPESDREPELQKNEVKTEPMDVGTTPALADENSNGSQTLQQPPPLPATFNDVSNSSTNSNSCGTASSNLSNSSSLGSNSHATTSASIAAAAATTTAALEHGTELLQQQAILSGKGVVGPVAPTAAVVGNSLSSSAVAAAAAGSANQPTANANTTAAVA